VTPNTEQERSQNAPRPGSTPTSAPIRLPTTLRRALIPVRNDTSCLVLRTHLPGKEVPTDCVRQAGRKESPTSREQQVDALGSGGKAHNDVHDDAHNAFISDDSSFIMGIELFVDGGQAQV
jgi:hypothetical protein